MVFWRKPADRLERALADRAAPNHDRDVEACLRAADALKPAIHLSESARAATRTRLMLEAERLNTPLRHVQSTPDVCDVFHEKIVELGEGTTVHLANVEQLDDETAHKIAEAAADLVRNPKSHDVRNRGG